MEFRVQTWKFLVQTRNSVFKYVIPCSNTEFYARVIVFNCIYLQVAFEGLGEFGKGEDKYRSSENDQILSYILYLIDFILN